MDNNDDVVIARVESNWTNRPPSTAETHVEMRARKRDDGRPVHPLSLPRAMQVTNLDIDVTENCNLGCLYCFKGELYSENMSLDTMKRTLEWLLNASGTAPTVNCNFMGGEPTMRFKQIREFVPWARRRGRQVGKSVTFSMTTNLTLFTEEIRAFVDQYGFGVLMSIDGCPEVQDQQRPAKNGKKQSETIEYWAKSMLQTRPRSQARATLHPDYIDYFAKSVSYLESIGFQEAAVSASEYEKWSATHFERLEAQYELILHSVLANWTKGSQFTLSSFKYFIEKLIHPRRTGKQDLIEFQPQPCGAGKGYMMVDYMGDVWPCHRFDGADTAAAANGQFRLGNIYEPGFNHPLQAAFLAFDHRTMHKASCTTCPVNEVCGGYCPAANLSDTGSIYTPHDNYCRWSQMTYVYAERFYDGVVAQGGEALNRLLAIAKGTTGTGEK